METPGDRAVTIGKAGRLVFTTNADPEHGLPALEDESVALTITRVPPPANWQDADDLLDPLAAIIHLLHLKTAPGGKIAVVAADAQSREKPHLLLSMAVEMTLLMARAGFRLCDEIAWHPVPMPDGGPGSPTYPGDPRIARGWNRRVMIFGKDGTREPEPQAREISRLEPEQWREWPRPVWEILPDPGQTDEVPLELARRVTALYSLAGDTVVDPWAGTGSVALAADKLRRRGVGYEDDKRFRPETRNSPAE